MNCLCGNCKNHVAKNKMPTMSNQNTLMLLDISNYEELQVTELENAMNALNIISLKEF